MKPTTKILEKLYLIRTEIDKIEKAGYNQHSNYYYLSDEDLNIAIKKLFDKHKVLFTYSSEITNTTPTPSNKQLLVNVRVTYALSDVESGETITGYVDGQGADQTDKGVYKAITGAIKYIYIKTFNIPTKDDPENDGEPTKPTPPKPEMDDLTSECLQHHAPMVQKWSDKKQQYYWCHTNQAGQICFGKGFLEKKQ